jgi:hypothetical protein
MIIIDIRKINNEYIFCGNMMKYLKEIKVKGYTGCPKIRGTTQ